MSHSYKKSYNWCKKECKFIRNILQKRLRLKIKLMIKKCPNNIANRDVNLKTQGWESY